MLPLLPLPPSEIKDKAPGWRRWLLGAFLFTSIVCMVLDMAAYFANGCKHRFGTAPPSMNKKTN
jgi:hypothetical protein